MAILGWGLDPWGLGAWGATTSTLSVVSAAAVDTRTVRVVLSAQPLAASPSGVGDALNAATWAVTRLDTGAPFTVASVTKINATTFDVGVVEAFGGAAVQHRAAAPALTLPNGILISAPTSATFAGMAASATATTQDQLAHRKFTARDVANPPVRAGGTSVGGTLVMQPGGDYATVTGAELVKKLIYRRLTTRLGEFFHLPNYGVGAIAVKEPMTTSSLAIMQREALRQVQLEPEVQRASVSITLDAAAGILTIQVRARIKPTGESLDAAFKLPVGGV